MGAQTRIWRVMVGRWAFTCSCGHREVLPSEQAAKDAESAHRAEVHDEDRQR